MSRWFNIAGPCIAVDHYMFPASERLPEVKALIRKKQYFVVHAPRQCGKTTAFRALMDEINAKGDMAAMYCSVEAVQTWTDPDKAMPELAAQLWTGQVFEEGALAKAWDYSRGQPWLVNALARWCVEEIHKEDFSKPVTAADMDAAKEGLIRERGTHLDTLMEKVYDPCIQPIVEKMMVGENIDRDVQKENLRYAIELGLLVDDCGTITPANPIYTETIGRYLTRGTQDFILSETKENVWVKGGKLDMPALMSAFQDFWRENATPESFVSQNFHEAYPHFVLQAFLQRVVNGGGQIIREMAIGRGCLDLGVKFGTETYSVEIKTAALYAKSPEKAHDQILKYMDGLGVDEGWLVVADADVTKPWGGKISTTDMSFETKTVHLVRC